MSFPAKPDPRPPKRIRDSKAGTEKVRAEGRCRACGAEGRATVDGGILNRAHLVPRGQGGDDVDANLIPLCGSGTTGCHAAFDGQSLRASSPSLLNGTRAELIVTLVWLSLRREEERYVFDKKGIAWHHRRFRIGSA